ncbi:MAG: 2-dehydropantoate 2-reductase [Deltaproteobacteria bacterium]|nr:2-dehydropantoate 2-reductase [Deltaproteobacteria bacterium]
MSKRVLVVGCGAIGGVISARLARARVDVTPVTGNPNIARTISSHGFQVREFGGETWSARARDPVVHARELPSGERFGTCIVATKSTSLVPALEAVLPYLAPDAFVVCCQNGLPEELAAGVVGKDRVLGCVVVFGATMEVPGEYVVTSKTSSLQLGRPFLSSPSLSSVESILAHVAPVHVVQNLTACRLSKLAINCATSTLGAVSGERLGSLLARRLVRRIVLEIWTEVAEVARASGIAMVKVPGTLDIAKLALTPQERAAPLGSPTLMAKHSIIMAVGLKYRRMRSSMLIALERGRTPEIDFLNGEISRRGRALGVPTPVNDRLVQMVHEIMQGKRAPSVDHLREVYEDLVLQRIIPRLAA